MEPAVRNADSGRSAHDDRASERAPLELAPEAMRELVALALDHVVAFTDALPEAPLMGEDRLDPADCGLDGPLPESGRPPAALLDTVFRELVPPGLNTASPGFLAYIPGGGLFHSAVADLITNAVNRYVGVYQAAPGLVQLESTVIRWFCDMVGFDTGSGGFLSSGGSIANLSAVVAARTEHLGDQLARGTLYLADQTHHSVAKAALLAGLPRGNLRTVPVDRHFRVRIDALRDRLRRDRAAGWRPFLIVGNAGTTNTGAVDDLVGLADLATEAGVWLHVDAAYGGFFLLTRRGRRMLRGIERADSVTLDPHKGMFLPYGTGCLLVRDRSTLTRSHRADAAYLPARDGDGDQVDFCDLSPELSRPVRGLRVWLPLAMHGARVFRDALEEKLDLAAWAAEQIASMPRFELVAPPQLSALAFRLAVPDADRATRDRLNRALLDGVNARQRVRLTGTTLDDGFVLRICVLSHRTHRRHVAHALADLRAAADTLVPPTAR